MLLYGPIVYRYRCKQRKHDSERLYRESNCSQVAGGGIQVRERQ
jgi:hypothetical protein